MALRISLIPNPNTYWSSISSQTLTLGWICFRFSGFCREQATVGLVPYRRLLDRVDRARTEGEGPGKGILVVSGSRELDPKRRPTQFTSEVLRGCQSQGFCLLTTYDLYKLVKQALEKSDDAALASLRRGLVECDGEYRGAR